MDSHCIDTYCNLIINPSLIIAYLFLYQIALRGIDVQAESLAESDQTLVTNVATLMTEVATSMTEVATLMTEVATLIAGVVTLMTKAAGVVI